MNRRGFTIIELLLGITIFAIISTGIYAAFAGGIRLSEQAEKQNSLFRESRWAMDLINRELENMAPFDFTASYPELRAFTGEQDGIRFITPGPQGLRVVSYYLDDPDTNTVLQTLIGHTYSKNVDMVVSYSETGEERQYLVRSEQSFSEFVNQEDIRNDQIEVIASSVAAGSLAFRYAYGDPGDPTGLTVVWGADWKAPQIPAQIEIGITFLPRDEDGEPLTVTRQFLVPHGYLVDWEA